MDYGKIHYPYLNKNFKCNKWLGRPRPTARLRRIADDCSTLVLVWQLTYTQDILLTIL